MRAKGLRLGAVLATTLALALTGCGREGAPGGGEPQVQQNVAQNVQVPGSPTFDRIKQRGRVTVGVKEDQPGLGFRDPVTGQYSGFDIEIARLVAAQLGLDPNTAIDYKPIPSTAREQALATGEVDYYVGTYTINDKRKEQVGFAGPYFMAGQDVLVRKDNTDITGPETLKGKKVCSATGSTPIQRVKEQQLTEPQNIVEFQRYSECVQQLLDGQIDAVTTDDAILKGYAAQDPDKLKVVGKTFSEEPYGIGVAKDDIALRNKINDVLEQAAKSGEWKRVYDATLGKSGTGAEPPPVDRY
ncbi:amino acid ABC transporter substrate-binding protein (PAAT family) [Saccharopolyspora erythraea NRRL 2338]|uniref:Glutamate binding protein n=2 Tax=Saccharopolyspora erythraea TaxID=1836 RepID=A4FAI8_SACEN|nr:glutamate ABC transporter substrate-binding protein [Saccharopolyspora erythraea]EQD82788.1 ABC transporter substrate-binding protein [Saccharopolyspora erythraea D]PFG94851.1 amino acid ABC transporter substrate-binding protein (PAAT family) [Saccharopolyspora erythraea NRRL 2338]QRK91556.1 glutamate ABC transporter substrate-binding protein [Saccharopolyspora erythraea]CAM01063.1 putative glutamate binding protein [Saccharopolyspora erythraea NRRL 2338]